MTSFSAGCSLHQQPGYQDPPETTSPEDASQTLPISVSLQDVPGVDIPDLPRYPGSVRIGYESWEEGRVIFTRVRYLTSEELDTVRGFYRGVFRSEGWDEADAGFSEGAWSFFVTDGEREATVDITNLRGSAVEIDIELSESRSDGEIAQKPAGSTSDPTQNEAPDQAPAPAAPGLAPGPAPVPVPDPVPAPAPDPVPAPVSDPAPAPVLPAPVPAPTPVPGDDDSGGDGDDDGGDDGGGDD